MNPILRNVLAVLAGFVGGSMLNMGIIIFGSTLIPAPEGVDIMDAESIAANIHLFGPKHFISPFLAHALGTLAGAFLTGWLVVQHKMKFAMGIGALFLLAGISNVFMIPAPIWFIVVDLAAAYLPMAYLGGILAQKVPTPGA